MVRVYTGRDMETKKRTYLNQTVHGGLRDAQAHLNNMLGERDCGHKLDSSKQTLNQAVPCPTNPIQRHPARGRRRGTEKAQG
jgi:hypothetical protein